MEGAVKAVKSQLHRGRGINWGPIKVPKSTNDLEVTRGGALKSFVNKVFLIVVTNAQIIRASNNQIISCLVLIAEESTRMLV